MPYSANKKGLALYFEWGLWEYNEFSKVCFRQSVMRQPSIGVTPFWRKFLAVSGSPSSPLAPPVEVLRLFRTLCLSNDRCFPFRPRETKEKKAKCLRVGIYICSHLKRGYFKFQHTRLTLQAPTPQNGQTHSNNSSAIAIFFECVWPFCGVGAWRVKGNFFINPFRVRCFFLYH